MNGVKRGDGVTYGDSSENDTEVGGGLGDVWGGDGGGRWGTGKDAHADHPARALQLCAVEGGGRRPRGAAGGQVELHTQKINSETPPRRWPEGSGPRRRVGDGGCPSPAQPRAQLWAAVVPGYK